ncbi:MAG TPA: PHP domain-containing protein [Gammaproteobacteria bacterium]|nr:PHP domain-containing protein [Gammaproteobacteria bacterium]
MLAPIDWHTHSTASDGTLSPTALMRHARECGVEEIALTDHDTLAGLDEAARAARESSLRFVPGIELSVDWRHHTLHIVGLGIDPDNSGLKSLTHKLAEMRTLRARNIGARLNKLGHTGAYEGACLLADNDRPGRAHFARYLARQGRVKNVGDAFKRLLGRGKPAYIATDWPAQETTIQIIHGAGGWSVLAHPLRYQLTAAKVREMLVAFKSAGGVGMEIVNGRQTQDETDMLTRLAQRHEFRPSWGSDFHSPHH